MKNKQEIIVAFSIWIFLCIVFVTAFIIGDKMDKLDHCQEISKQNIETYQELKAYTEYLENLILNETIEYEDLYINIDEINNSNATIYTREDFYLE